MAIQQELQGLELITINGAEVVTEASKVNLEFLTDGEINKLLPVAAKWGTKTLSQQISALNHWTSELNGSKIMPLTTVTKEGEALYHHGTYLSTIRCFSPLLQSFSGDGKSLGKFELKLNSILTFQVTVNHCPIKEDGEDYATVLKKKRAHLMSVIKLRTSEGIYEVGKVLPNGTELFHLEYHTGVVPGACTDKGSNWRFICAKKPVISKSDVDWIGMNMETATKARVTIRIPGWYVAESNAEKFAGVLTKIMLDPMPIASSLNDLKWGSTLMYESNLSIEASVTAILDGSLKSCPHPLVYSGQETSKGASTAPISAAAIHAMTGKYVARRVETHQQKLLVGGKETLHNVGDVTWDSDSFVHFRREWNKASIHWAVITKWIPASLYPVFYKSVGGNSDSFKFVPYPVNTPVHLAPTGYLVFHKCEVRAELSPLTMETSTVGENNKTDSARGSLFSELIQIISKVGDPVIAKVLYATSWKARKLADMVIALGDNRYVSREDAEELGVKCVDPLVDKVELPENPQEALNTLSKKVGEVFWVPLSESDPEGEGCLISPLVGMKLGLAPGSQLNLYSKVIFDIATLLNTKLELDETVFTKEWAQAMSAHRTVVTQMLRGEEINENVSSILGDTTRAQFVWSSKVGACIFQGVNPNGLHVSTDHALASKHKQGSYHLVWRNPMAFILGLKVVAVGPATDNCPTPDIVTEEQILGNNKVYLYPTTWYKTAGDVDGDICQGIDLTWLMAKWVTKKANHTALKAVGVFKQLFKVVE